MTAHPPLAQRPAGAVVGETVPHESALAHTTGTALFTDDLGARFVDLLEAYPVCSPHPHARITRLDPGPALAVDGVVHVLTRPDVPGVNDGGVKHDEPLFPDEVHYVGQPVCWVLATSREAARRGADAVVVEYEELPAIITVRQAIQAGSYQAELPTIRRGDVDDALAQAPVRVSGDLVVGGQEHFYLETHVAIAVLDEAGQVLVHSSTQHPTETQDIVSHVLGVPAHRVSVQCLRMGGGFGGKEMQPHALAAVAALGAVRTGRPVRLRLSRAQDLVMTGKRHPFHLAFDAGLSPEGDLLAVRADLVADGGWSLDLSEPVLARAMCHVDNAYWTPAVQISGRVARTNKTSQTAFRGFGGPQGMFVVEEILGRAAGVLAIPAADLRRRNLYREGQPTPYGQPVRQADRLPAMWDDLDERADLTARRDRAAAFNAAHDTRKRALAVTPVKFGISFNFTAFNQAGALVHVYKDGSVLVSHGGTEMGQGLHTKMLAVAATALGVPPNLVRLAPTRTDKVPNTSATAASSGSDLNGGAVRDACLQIQGRLAALAAQVFGVDAGAVEFRAGTVGVPGRPDLRLTWADLVSQAYFARICLWASGFYRTEGIHWDRTRMTGEPFKYFAYGLAASEVEVDGLTGEYRLLRTDIVQDVGDSLSPLIDLGQVEGGFVQGVGWLTLEELLWQAEPPEQGGQTGYGRLLTAGASTYKLPSLAEMPEDFNVHFLEHATEPGAVYGAKAVGEPPLMLAFSVREALRDAVAAFGPGGVGVELASPATPEAVFWAVERQRCLAGAPTSGFLPEGYDGSGEGVGGALV